MDGIQEVPMSGVAPSASPIIGIEKRCTKCGEIKPVESFYHRRKLRDGFSSWCKACSNETTKKWKDTHRPLIRELENRWAKKNREKIREQARGYYLKNAERLREKSLLRYYLNPQKCKDSAKKWSRSNPEKMKELYKKANRKRRGTPRGRLDHRMSAAIRIALKKNKNGRCWKSLTGYSLDRLVAHIEKQFKAGMNWDAFMRGEIHIDHIIPKAAFNYEKPEDDDFKRCWALKNLQPLWATDNWFKKDKINKHFQPSLIFKQRAV